MQFASCQLNCQLQLFHKTVCRPDKANCDTLGRQQIYCLSSIRIFARLTISFSKFLLYFAFVSSDQEQVRPRIRSHCKLSGDRWSQRLASDILNALSRTEMCDQLFRYLQVQKIIHLTLSWSIPLVKTMNAFYRSVIIITAHLLRLTRCEPWRNGSDLQVIETDFQRCTELQWMIQQLCVTGMEMRQVADTWYSAPTILWFLSGQ